MQTIVADTATHAAFERTIQLGLYHKGLALHFAMRICRADAGAGQLGVHRLAWLHLLCRHMLAKLLNAIRQWRNVSDM